MSEPLRPEVAAALDCFGHRAERWQRISTLRAERYGRAAFRVDLVGGGILKARCLANETMARELFEFRQAAPPAFAPVLHRHGSVLLEAWIAGDDVSRRSLTSRQLCEAAALLADLHGTTDVAGSTLPATLRTDSERAKAEHARRCLAAAGHLSRTESEAIGAALARMDPQHARAGVVHTDFCGENMVIDAGGQLHVIDNEMMGVGALALDVARAWYRWPMPAVRWDVFRTAYCARSTVDDTLRDFDFWTLVATLKSASLRLDLNPGGVGVSLECLRRIIAGVQAVAR